MGYGARISRMASPELKECANLDCNYSFWGYGPDKYCCPKCKKHTAYLSNKERTRRWREKNPEKLLKYQKDYYKKNKEKIKNYPSQSKEKRKAYNKKYYAKNKEKLLARQKERREERKKECERNGN